MMQINFPNKSDTQIQECSNKGVGNENSAEFAGILKSLNKGDVSETKILKKDNNQVDVKISDDIAGEEVAILPDTLVLFNSPLNLPETHLETDSGEKSLQALAEVNLSNDLQKDVMGNLTIALKEDALTPKMIKEIGQTINQFTDLQKENGKVISLEEMVNGKGGNEGEVVETSMEVLDKSTQRQGQIQQLEEEKIPLNNSNIAEETKLNSLKNGQILDNGLGKNQGEEKENSKINFGEVKQELTKEENKQRLSLSEEGKNPDISGEKEKQAFVPTFRADKGIGTNNFTMTLDSIKYSNESEPEVTVKEIPQFILKQISGKIINKNDGTQELNIRLKPAELGRMSLQLTTQEGHVAIKIITDNIHSRELVEQNIIHLKQALVDQGIKCNSIDVQVNTDSSFNQFMGHQSNPFNQSRQSGKNKFVFSNGKNTQGEVIADMENSINGRNLGLSNLEILA